MSKLHDMKDKLVCKAYTAIMEDIDSVCVEELGEVIDMIKDLQEAIYYHTVTEAMKNPESYIEKYMPSQPAPAATPIPKVEKIVH